jgi:hypothetical protein
MTKFRTRIGLEDLPEDQPLMIVCVVEADLAECGPSTAGDALRPCGGCLRVVRVAPSSQSLLADAERLGRTVKVRCWRCAEPNMEAAEEFGLAPGALEEIAAHGKRK